MFLLHVFVIGVARRWRTVSIITTYFFCSKGYSQSSSWSRLLCDIRPLTALAMTSPDSHSLLDWTLITVCGETLTLVTPRTKDYLDGLSPFRRRLLVWKKNDVSAQAFTFAIFILISQHLYLAYIVGAVMSFQNPKCLALQSNIFRIWLQQYPRYFQHIARNNIREALDAWHVSCNHRRAASF